MNFRSRHDVPLVKVVTVVVERADGSKMEVRFVPDGHRSDVLFTQHFDPNYLEDRCEMILPGFTFEPVGFTPGPEGLRVAL